MELQTMENAGLADFLFTGLAVVPGVLLLTGHVGAAILLFIPLLTGACLFSMYQQQMREAQKAADSAVPDARAVLQPSAHGGERLQV